MSIGYAVNPRFPCEAHDEALANLPAPQFQNKSQIGISESFQKSSELGLSKKGKNLIFSLLTYLCLLYFHLNSII